MCPIQAETGLVVAASSLSTIADELDQRFQSLQPTDRLLLLSQQGFSQQGPGRIVFTTSLGIEDQAITHMIASAGLAIEIATLDTGRLFPQSYDVWAASEERYGLRIKSFAPQAQAVQALVADQGINGFYHLTEARKACCQVRKLEPLARAFGLPDCGRINRIIGKDWALSAMMRAGN